jgi:uncharacterized protein (TIGR02594 family)
MLGEEEIPGPVDNPEIVAFHRSVDDGIVGEGIAWCSSYVNWCIDPFFAPTNSRAARSWLNWGVGLGVPVYGCICVLWRESPESWKGHVGFYLGAIGNDVLLLSGNDSNEVTARRFPKSRVLGYRMPEVS